ncbi:mycofactocin biosynthesis chaperone MftB [Gordonia desulfuricans]|uniref:Mycofactocin biosynthesis chaperone MftB n=1 Tax=Gordonia desulfuricans TaxID=89051 RepID=A0A7K3LR49_9ACTN|nr:MULTISPECIES: mycofactocin biosynthesis chaperone MftB [Gordonia]EMP14540.2 hypothetical protein ISGA_2240 [Gordonia sp. NB41Y]NDK90670.1 mycofactocin biosynthesis chaperone MftB [Gordonia desulfuricans]WLP89653.1 mycofactocin biosynthesis chaperone MftB [Gordonia sp. NB41Y]
MSSPTSAPVAGDRPAVTGGRSADPAPTHTPRAATAFDLDAAWELNPKVALRPEPFGALLYHFGTRKLSFLKNLTVVGIVQSLSTFDTAEQALSAAAIDTVDRPLYLQALATLADSGMITRR